MADATALRARTIQHYGDVFREAEQMVVNELREAAPLGATGETRRGIEAVPQGNATTHFASTIVSKAKQGDYVEDGTRPHEIRPRNGQALRFPGSGGAISTASPNQRVPTRPGGVVFAKVVHHPGTPPRPWFAPIVARWDEFLQRAAARVR